MRFKRLAFLVIGTSMVGFAAPSVMLPLLTTQPSPQRSAALSGEGLEARRIKADAKRVEINYLEETQQAITRHLAEKGARNFEVSQIVFTSEKTKRIAGQKQVDLSFTFQLQLKDQVPQELPGEIRLASDADGNWFNTSVQLK
ncbi:hypothetical protein HUW51_00865 (plasmid) [Adhaeribacter swui]|uniref:Uncharacterized protein n=1 Tax=Adhaeribacter swui TaxID=2086471 RepID=A0A7G7G2F5_9BACT|nr:hypothetical protein [Adhaeribacter swui]QNF31339.1 hypothetical protein HUW51_00865 [Adhaeribacter swui]